MQKTILYLLVLLLLPFLVLIFPFLVIYLCEDRYFDYREKVKGISKVEKKMNNASINNWANDNR